ncbi:MAG: AMP phosphorylase [Candidatus Bathyarchaeota archaeon]|nr:AMP phosphorylase [Candidatus Bathyarchaeota archaeon]
MELIAGVLNITTGGKRIVILNDETAAMLGVHSSDRVKLSYGGKKVIAIANLAADFPADRIWFYTEIAQALGVTGNENVDVQLAPMPESLGNVRAKLRGQRLRDHEITTIVKDVVEQHLSDIEISAFLTALKIYGLSMAENEALSRAMVETGMHMNFGEGTILDKHSIGGIPGDKTSMILVPIVAAAGFTIPKTSSRAITSPAGTADRVETLCPVNLEIGEIQRVVKKTGGCLVWGGALDLAPADDLFIRVEYPLGIDPMLLPSIMSKKKAMGATHLVVDIPTGMGAKIKTPTEAYSLAADFVHLGNHLGINVHCALTFGEQPLGCGIGPALEAREALNTLMGKGPVDVHDKAVSIAGMLFELVGKKNGRQLAEEMLHTRKAECKMRQIIEAQGGNPNVKPEDIPVGPEHAEVRAKGKGRVLWIKTEGIVQVARAAGTPKEAGAGIMLHTKLGDAVAKGDVLFEVYAERASKLQSALALAEKLEPVVLSRKPEERMLLDQYPAKTGKHEKSFMLDR